MHEANDHRSRHLRRTCYNAELFDGLGGKGAFEMCYSFLYFVGMHFWIFVHKFFVHLRTVYASPEKLARLLTVISHGSCCNRAAFSCRTIPQALQAGPACCQPVQELPPCWACHEIIQLHSYLQPAPASDVHAPHVVCLEHRSVVPYWGRCSKTVAWLFVKLNMLDQGACGGGGGVCPNQTSIDWIQSALSWTWVSFQNSNTGLLQCYSKLQPRLSLSVPSCTRTVGPLWHITYDCWLLIVAPWASHFDIRWIIRMAMTCDKSYFHSFHLQLRYFYYD